MVAEPVAEEVVTTPESTDNTPASQAVPETPSQIEETPSGGTGAETLVTGESETEPQKPLEQWTLAELDAKGYSTGLNADETRRRDSLRQSAQQQWANEQDAIRRADWEETQRREALKTKFGDTVDKIVNLHLEGRDPDLVAELKQRYLAEAEGDLTSIALNAHDAKVTQALLSPQVYGDSIQNRRAIAALSFDEKVERLAMRAFELGRLAGPSSDHVVLTAKELEAKEKAAVKKAQDELIAANPGWQPPSGGGKSAGAEMTLAQIDAMPTNEWMSKPREERARLLDAAHRAVMK